MDSRSAWLRIHTWFGLSIAAFVSLLGVTGSILIFSEDIDRMLNPVLHTQIIQPSKQSLPLSELLASASRASPNFGKPSTLYLPVEDGTARFTFADISTRNPDQRIEVVTRRDTGKILFCRNPDEGILPLVYRLHSTLLTGIFGRCVVGVVALGLILSVITGLMLWWSSFAKLRDALTVKWSSSRARVLFDIHRATGIFGGILLLLIALSGVYLSLSGIFENWFSEAAELTPHIQQENVSSVSHDSVNLDQVTANALSHFPRGRLVFLNFPDDSTRYYTFNILQPEEPSMLWPRSVVWVDDSNGKILGVRDSFHVGIFATMNDWIFPLHDGQAWGTAGRFTYLFSGLIPITLAITGGLGWLMRVRHSRKNK